MPCTDYYARRASGLYIFHKNDQFDSLSDIEKQLPDKYKITTEQSYLVHNNPKSAVGDNVTLARFEKAE